MIIFSVNLSWLYGATFVSKFRRLVLNKYLSSNGLYWFSSKSIDFYYFAPFKKFNVELLVIEADIFKAIKTNQSVTKKTSFPLLHEQNNEMVNVYERKRERKREIERNKNYYRFEFEVTMHGKTGSMLKYSIYKKRCWKLNEARVWIKIFLAGNSLTFILEMSF